MSATHDKTQKIVFAFQNLRDLASQQATAAQAPVVERAQARVLKVEEMKNGVLALSRGAVESYNAPHFIPKRVVQKPEAVAALSSGKASPAIESLKQNLKTLNDLHSRLRFMLQELEDLVRE